MVVSNSGVVKIAPKLSETHRYVGWDTCVHSVRHLCRQGKTVWHLGQNCLLVSSALVWKCLNSSDPPNQLQSVLVLNCLWSEVSGSPQIVKHQINTFSIFIWSFFLYISNSTQFLHCQ